MNDRDWARAAPTSPEVLGLTRRGHVCGFFIAFTTYALLAEAGAATPMARTSPAGWIARQDEIGRALRAGQMRPSVWMTEVERLAAEVDLAELMATVGRSRITRSSTAVTNDPSHNDPGKRHVRFLDETGAPRRLSFAAALFDFGPRNVITPHGHKHMASAHLVVAGSFRVRNFDRLRDDGDAMVIAPTRDYIAGVGQVSTMSGARDNIHWFVPHGGPATTFDVVVSGLDAGADDYEIRAIDPLGGERLPEGAIKAPILDFEVASRRYTADV